MLRIGVPDLSELSDLFDLSDKGIQSTRQGAIQLAPGQGRSPKTSGKKARYTSSTLVVAQAYVENVARSAILAHLNQMC